MPDINDTGSVVIRVDLKGKDITTKVDSITADLMPPVMSTGFGTTAEVVSSSPGKTNPTFTEDLMGPEENDTPDISVKRDPVGTESLNNEEIRSSTPQPVTPDPPKVPEIDNRAVDTNKASSGDSKADGDNTVLSLPSSAPAKVDNQSVDPLAEDNSINSRPNRGRIVSLDRGRDRAGLISSDRPFTDDERHRRHANDRSSSHHARRSERHSGGDDSGDSSDDDSSYFATHLPDPKSGRSFSLSSTGSAPGRTSSYYQNSVKQESDASLSFSDESDDEMHQTAGVRISPMIPPKGSVADMHLYPQRITRMHSVSSLVSSASSEEPRHGDGRRSSMGSISSHNSTGTISDPSVQAELHDFAAAVEARGPEMLESASGRRSPIMGQQAYDAALYFGTPSPRLAKASPPTIMQAYASPSGMAHPQPLPMTTDQMAAWVSAGNAAQVFQHGQHEDPVGYGSIPPAMHRGQQNMVSSSHFGGFRSISDHSGVTVPFIYSEDDDTDEGFINRYAGGQTASGGAPPSRRSNNARGEIHGDIARGLSGKEGNGPSNGHHDLSSSKIAVRNGGDHGAVSSSGDRDGSKKGFKVYWQRWVMLLYMSVLNLLSDWTCYSVAPIAILTQEAFGDIDPEQLVVIFLGANAVATACEPIILARLGLRRTVLFGALLLMFGSIVKSGGIPPIIQSELRSGEDEWRLYFGFFLVGLSQPLYQCTPALLSASWFPEKERTMATGVALNANQLGIGFAFIFGTLLVSEKDDIAPYFGLLSLISTIAFMGTLIAFDDAPPTPPSETARVMRGTIEVNLPSMNTIFQSVRGIGEKMGSPRNISVDAPAVAPSPSPAASHSVGERVSNQASDIHESKQRRDPKSKRSSRKGSSTRRRANVSRSHVAQAPSAARSEESGLALTETARIKAEAAGFGMSPSPMMPGRVGGQGDPSSNQGEDDGSPLYEDVSYQHNPLGLNMPGQPGEDPNVQQHMGAPPGVPPGAMPPGTIPGGPPPFGAFPHPHYQYPYWDPRFQQQVQQQQAYYQQQYYYYQQQPPVPPRQYYYPMPYPPHLQNYESPQNVMPAAAGIDDGAEPVVTFTPHHLDIDIRDDQVLLSIRACLSRPGFIHALVCFTVSGIVINTLSTYMDYLVRLNGAPRAYTGIVGGTFQFVIMISSLVVGSQTDKTRAYYSVIIGMLVLGAFGLAECGVSLDSDRGSELRWSLVVVAALVGPLQPVSTELGVDVAFPLSENTVLVIQQLFSNLLSAAFIPVFKALKDFGRNADEDEMLERPEYTFSFYLLIVIHAAATVFFATFNGRYLRYEQELQKKADEEREANEAAFHPFYDDVEGDDGERQPLVSQTI